MSPLTCLSSFCCMRLELSTSMALKRQKAKTSQTAVKTSLQFIKTVTARVICWGSFSFSRQVGEGARETNQTRLQLRGSLIDQNTFVRGPGPCCLATGRRVGQQRESVELELQSEVLFSLSHLCGLFQYLLAGSTSPSLYGFFVLPWFKSRFLLCWP